MKGTNQVRFLKKIVANVVDLYIGDPINSYALNRYGTDGLTGNFRVQAGGYKITGTVNFAEMSGECSFGTGTYRFSFDENGIITDVGIQQSKKPWE